MIKLEAGTVVIALLIAALFNVIHTVNKEKDGGVTVRPAASDVVKNEKPERKN